MMEILGSLADTPYYDFITPAIPAFIIMMLAEGFLLVRDKDGEVLGYTLKDTLASLSMGIGSLFIPKVISGLIGFGLVSIIWRDYRLFDFGNGWVAWTLAMVGKDFFYYWSHRFGHEWRGLWAAHVVHHSSQKYNLSTALRQTWSPGFTFGLFYAPMAFLGVNPTVLAMAGALNLLYQFWIHTEAVDKLHPLFELVFNTPSHHRVHHAIQQHYLDRNYGGILIVWDRWFGTFEPEGERPVYGLTTQLDTFNPLVIATHEYRDLIADMIRDDSWSTRLQRPFRGPGWRRHDKSAPALTAEPVTVNA